MGRKGSCVYGVQSSSFSAVFIPQCNVKISTWPSSRQENCKAVWQGLSFAFFTNQQQAYATAVGLCTSQLCIYGVVPHCCMAQRCKKMYGQCVITSYRGAQKKKQMFIFPRHGFKIWTIKHKSDFYKLNEITLLSLIKFRQFILYKYRRKSKMWT